MFRSTAPKLAGQHAVRRIDGEAIFWGQPSSGVALRLEALVLLADIECHWLLVAHYD